MNKENYKLVCNIINSSNEFSCDNTYPNLLIWYPDYNVIDGQIIVKTNIDGINIYRLPIGGDIETGIDYIKKCENCKYPIFWNSEGGRLEEFREKYGDNYTFIEDRDTFDYVYSRENLVNLFGQKYHSKRNHISSFNKKYDWHFEPLNDNNINNIRECANKWYASKEYTENSTLAIEKNRIDLLLDNYKELNIKGGCIVVDRNVVAFSLGSEINSQTFDVCIEKALPAYAESYSVINREFAKTLDYKYINREDDMGIEGLRKAKMSYHPDFFVKKYYCYPKQ